MSGLIRFYPDRVYLVYHPSGPDFNGLLANHTFVAGRVPGFVNGDIAARLEAFGAIAVDYHEGLEIVDWKELGGDMHRMEPLFAIGKEPVPTEEMVRETLVEAIARDPAAARQILADFADYASDAPLIVKDMFDRVYREFSVLYPVLPAPSEGEKKATPPGSGVEPSQDAGAAPAVEAADPGGVSASEEMAPPPAKTKAKPKSSKAGKKRK